MRASSASGGCSGDEKAGAPRSQWGAHCIGAIISELRALALLLRYLLITKQWEEEARKALRKLRASNQVEADIEEMRAEEQAQQTESAISMTELICSPTLRTPLVIGVVMQLSQQLSGINAVSTRCSLSLYALCARASDCSQRLTALPKQLTRSARGGLVKNAIPLALLWTLDYIFYSTCVRKTVRLEKVG